MIHRIDPHGAHWGSRSGHQTARLMALIDEGYSAAAIAVAIEALHPRYSGGKPFPGVAPR
jgi:hypothetical protein